MKLPDVMLLYGLKTCDTSRKALKELEKVGMNPRFIDLRASPQEPEKLEQFINIFGDRLINRRSLTWKKLSKEQRAQPTAVLIGAYPTLMKRPIVDSGNRMTIGWDNDVRRVWGLAPG